MFVDNALVRVKAGNGGNGVVSFRHEKYVDRGGPDGGDGGRGGDVVFVGRENQHTLAQFRHQKELRASDGSSGGKRKKRGKSATALIIPVPVGTAVIDSETQEELADITKNNQEVTIAVGGSGGFGNAHFTSSTRQAPRVAEKGEPGEEKLLQLELKMIADVGLVGLPNAGKSTFLSIVSNARPEIADYPFTTLRPNLGVVDIDDTNGLLLADIPGLIQGASTGKGLGDEFLRHVERTAVLLHLIDVFSDDVTRDYKTIQDELKQYRIDLSQKAQVVALTKIEGVDKKTLTKKQTALKKVIGGKQLFAISAQAKQGIKPLLHKLEQFVDVHRQQQAESEQEAEDEATKPVISLPETEDDWSVRRRKKHFIVSGKKIERFAHKTESTSEPAMQRLRDIMRKMGIMHELERQGVHSGDRIKIADIIELRY